MSVLVEKDLLPRWDMTPLYSGLEEPSYRADFVRLDASLSDLEQYFTKHQIGRHRDSAASKDAELVELLQEILGRLNAILLLEDRLGSYVYAFFTTDSYNAVAAREMSKLEMLGTRRQKLQVRLSGWIGSLTDRLTSLVGHSELLARHEFFLKDTAEQSKYLMNEELEGLAAELCLDAGTAFGKLQGNVTSQLKVQFERDGKQQELPITVIRNLSYDPDPAVRERAYRTEQQGWHSIRTTVAACMNGVKGTAITLARRRGRPSVLHAALDSNKIDQPTLDALLGAIREHLPTFRRYLKSKAAKLGRDRLPWWDLFAPLSGANKTFSWKEARDFIVEQFSGFSDELGQYAARAFDENWIDAEPRDGKRGGAYCMPVMAIEQSRVLANFDGSFDQLSTLAHELGHGFHNHCQKGLEPLRRGSPSTLAETASIFCETLVAEGALRDASASEQLMILEAQLGGATQVCLDITSRFIFESAVLQRREKSELSAEELCELMLAAQRETYGDGVDETTYHRYMWLWKPHYYSHDHNFYNFPYAFGHLFGLGLYAVYQQQGKEFLPRYSELLRATGQDYAAPLAARFDIDLRTLDFWRDSLKVIEAQVERYEKLT